MVSAKIFIISAKLIPGFIRNYNIRHEYPNTRNYRRYEKLQSASACAAAPGIKVTAAITTTRHLFTLLNP